ncbi:MAG: uridylate kinase [Herpetosiphonaceae bacterium]|nr:uridylate kinase [Herpetosiphonaceae bacterium]
MSELVLLKLGGSVLTDKRRPEALQTAVLHDMAQSIRQLLEQHGELRLVIGHGGGSFGHHWAARYGTQHGIHDPRGWQGFARVQDAQGRLNRAVVAILIEAGINAVSLQPSAGAIAASGVIEHWDLTGLTAMLSHDLVPVIYGDVVIDRDRSAAIISTEQLFGYLVPRLKPQRLVLVGEGGVWTADPRHNAQATLIPTINQHNIEAVLAQSGASYGVDVTGGMASKVATMWRVAQATPGLTIHFVGPGALRTVWEQGASAGTVMHWAETDPTAPD